MFVIGRADRHDSVRQRSKPAFQIMNRINSISKSPVTRILTVLTTVWSITILLYVLRRVRVLLHSVPVRNSAPYDDAQCAVLVFAWRSKVDGVVSHVMPRIAINLSAAVMWWNYPPYVPARWWLIHINNRQQRQRTTTTSTAITVGRAG